MENTVNERLNIFIEYLKNSKNISKVGFAGSIGRVKQDVDRWVNGGVKIPVPEITKILMTYRELSSRWLLTGEGDMLEFENVGISAHQVKQEDPPKDIVSVLKHTISKQEEEIEWLRSLISKKEGLESKKSVAT